MQTVKGSEIRSLLENKGPSAWVDLALRYGRTFRSSGVVLTCDPGAVSRLLMDKTHTEVRPVFHRLLARIPGANGILFMEGEPWLKRIRAVMPAFHRDHVDGFALSLQELTKTRALEWEQKRTVPDLFAAVQELGAASVLKMGYGIDPEHPLVRQLAAALIDYKQTTMNPDPRRRFDEFGGGVSKLPWLLAGIWLLRGKTARVQDAVRRLMIEGVDRAEWGWVQQLVDSGMSEKEIACEINHLYGAFNAVDYIVACALYELARNRDMMSGIQRELDSILPGDAAPPTRTDLAQMPLTRGFILEILRMYPVSMGVSRRTGADMDIGGEKVPASTDVVIMLYSLHHYPDFWDRPQELLPARWDASGEPKTPFSYLPFLDGHRKCIGRSMAEMHLLTVLATLMRRYDISIFADAVIPPFMIPRFAGPLPFLIRPRRSDA